MKNSKILLTAAALISSGVAAVAQTEPDTTYTKVEDYFVTENSHRVITNPGKSNWYVMGDAGVNAFFGDKHVGAFKYRLTPQFNIGAGKWIVPGFGLDLQFTGFRSKSHKGVNTNLFTRDEPMRTDKSGNNYWQETIKWWDLSFNAKFNITRLIYGYEGDNSPRLMNQFIASVGIGYTHNYGLSYGSSNEWSGHVELQYSRFFTPAKAVSLDVKLRGMLYDTRYDGFSNNGKTDLIDMNLSLNVGATYYFNYRGWERKSTHTTIYNQYNQAKIIELNEEINRLRSMPVPEETQNTNIVDILKDVVTFPYLVNFVIDRVEVVNRERVNLGVVAAMMKATPELKYLITGYADKHTGTVKRNEWLAENRAKNTFKVLTEEFGVPASQLILDDKGGVENMYYDDPQLSRSAIITVYEENQSTTKK